MPPKQSLENQEHPHCIQRKQKSIKKPTQKWMSIDQYAKLTKRAIRVQMRSIQKDFSVQKDQNNNKQYLRESNQKLLTSFFQFKNQTSLSDFDKSKASTAHSEISQTDCQSIQNNQLFSQQTILKQKKKILRVVKKQKKKFNLLKLKPLRKGGRTQVFILLKEKNLGFSKAIQNRFKKLEQKTHQGVDQDVDTDEENLIGQTDQLKEQVQNAILNFQKEANAIEQINNLMEIYSQK
ncbi:UNKNOWN [Stylonychia lemnae]|uniref:Uncharacterized protein n=1 Tax=Stylonychia lemnae TaxID=5949 RepID=A0A078B7Y9_STYLE|nr:UNKNOWN [Stylonychia lemnae]|eukprot:CDW90336.1 UNKNOWN [Stylonychia lemnae]